MSAQGAPTDRPGAGPAIWKRVKPRWASASAIRLMYRWLLIAVPVGVIAGLGAVLFITGLDLASQGFLGAILGVHLPVNGVAPSSSATPSWTSDPSRFWAFPLVLVAAALSVGWLAYRFAPQTLGHGTDETIRAFHHGRGAVGLRVPLVKFVISVLTLGSGGSGGREGPTAQISSGLGSLLARPLGLTTRERRVALMVGMGAGIGAIFKAPFGASLLSAEILYLSDFEPEVIMPSIVASVISYSIFGEFQGFGPEFATPLGLGWSVPQLPFYVVLGLAAGLLAALYSTVFNRSKKAFQRLSLPLWGKPALGAGIAGLVTVGLYYSFPQYGHFLSLGIIGIGYGIVQWLFYAGNVTLILIALVAAFIIAKIVVTALVVGSGGSGGLFGPGVVLGASSGFAVAATMRYFAPSMLPAADLATFSIIGMMAFFGSVSKAPIAVIVMVVEMTGSEALIVPAMMTIFVAYYIAGPFQLYSEQVPNRLASPAHTTEYFAAFLEHVPVRMVVEPAPQPVHAEATIDEAQFLMTRAPVQLLPVVSESRLVGELRLADVLEVPFDRRPLRKVREEMRSELTAVDPQTSLLRVLGQMDQEGVDALLVLTMEKPPRVAGVVTREGIYRFQRAPGAPDEDRP